MHMVMWEGSGQHSIELGVHRHIWLPVAIRFEATPPCGIVRMLPLVPLHKSERHFSSTTGGDQATLKERRRTCIGFYQSVPCVVSSFAFMCYVYPTFAYSSIAL